MNLVSAFYRSAGWLVVCVALALLCARGQTQPQPPTGPRELEPPCGMGHTFWYPNTCEAETIIDLPEGVKGCEKAITVYVNEFLKQDFKGAGVDRAVSHHHLSREASPVATWLSTDIDPRRLVPGDVPEVLTRLTLRLNANDVRLTHQVINDVVLRSDTLSVITWVKNKTGEFNACSGEELKIFHQANLFTLRLDPPPVIRILGLIEQYCKVIKQAKSPRKSAG